MGKSYPLTTDKDKNMTMCKEFRSFHSCDGALIERDGVTLCAAHYRAKYVRELLKSGE